MNKLKSVIRYLLVCVAILIGSSGVFSQTTIVNYDFNQGTSYPTLSPQLVNNITSSASSTETWQSYTGISSGINAFTVNSIAGSALAMTSSSGTNTRYFQFHLGGSDLSTYASYKIYMQAQRSATGANTITLAYSTDGTNYTNFATTQSPGNGFFEQCQFDLSAISSLNIQSAIYFRLLVSGASGSGTLRIDNFQVRATQLTCISPTRLLYKTQPVTATQGAVMNVFSVATSCVSDSIATNCNSGNITLTYNGTNLSGTLTMPVINGVATFTDIAISTVQSNLSFTASYSGSCGNLSQAISNTFNVLPLRNENFDGSTPTWPYSINTPTVIGSGGIVGADVTGLKNYGSPNNNSLTKSYSLDNFSGEKGTVNTILFSNVTGLNVFDQVKFSFQIGSLGTGSGSGTDNGENLIIETSLDGGSTWNSLLKNNGYNDHLFALSSSSPVTLAYNANTIYSSGDSLWNQSAFQVNLPEGTNQFMFRITASSNRTNENWAIDNMTLQYVPLSIIAGSNQTITCSNPYATLTSTASTSNATYAWTGPSSGSTPTNSTNIVTVDGTYTVTATLPVSGKTATATVVVVSNTAIPTVSITNNPTITCSTPTAVLTGSSTTSGVTYSWSPGGITTSTLGVTVAGTYTLLVTNTVGCSASSTVSVMGTSTLPDISVAPYYTLSIIAPSATISGVSNTSGVTYSWTPGGSTPTSSATVVSSIGVYTLMVTNPTNSCVSTATVLVVNQLSATATISDYENDTVKGRIVLNIAGGVTPYKVIWNGLIIPLPAVAYKLLKDSLPTIVIDSVAFTHHIDSLRQRTIFDNLNPGKNLFEIYDQTDVSVIISASVDSKIHSWVANTGVTTLTNSISNFSAGNVNFYYGDGMSVTQTGTYSPGVSYAIPATNLNLLNTNEMSFVMSDNSDIAYVGILENNMELNGDTIEMNRRTLFRFNGDGTFTIIFNNQGIFNGTFSSGDHFSLSTNTTPGKISYFKNEIPLIESDISVINSGFEFTPKIILGSSGAIVSGLKIKFPFEVIPVLLPPFNKCILQTLFYSVNASASPNPVCIGATTNLTGSLINVLSSTQVTLPSSNYFWKPVNMTGQGPMPVLQTTSQIYTLEVTYASGCVLKKSLLVTVKGLAANAGPDAFVASGTNVVLGGTPAAYAGSGNYSYNWTPVTSYFPNSNIANPIVNATSNVIYTLTVNDNTNGCIKTDDKLVYIINDPYYFVLKKVLDAGYYNSYNNKIYFAFEEEYFDSNLSQIVNYEIVTDKNEPVTVSSPQPAEKIGDNRFTLSLSGLTPGEFYRLSITNKKNEVFYARFKY